nr:hypothetical protein [uncultured Rhodopila sp.]
MNCAHASTGDGWSLTERPIRQKGIIPLRSYVCETMRRGRLFLAADRRQRLGFCDH